MEDAGISAPADASDHTPPVTIAAPADHGPEPSHEAYAHAEAGDAEVDEAEANDDEADDGDTDDGDMVGPDDATLEAGDEHESEDGGEDSLVPGFAALGLSEPILRAVAEMGYVTPTPVQERRSRSC